MSSRFVQRHCIRGGAEFKSTVREEARMTVLVLCLIGAFFTCQSPFVVYSACRKVGILSTPSRGHSLLRAFIILALALKTDCTFVFHCWLNQRFALAIRRMLCSFSASKRNVRYHDSSAENSAMSNMLQEDRQLMNIDSTKGENRIKCLLREIKGPAFEMKERRIIQSPCKEGTRQLNLHASRIPYSEKNMMGKQSHLHFVMPPVDHDVNGYQKQPNSFKALTARSHEGQRTHNGGNSIKELYSDLAMNSVNSYTLQTGKGFYEQTQENPTAMMTPEKKKSHNRSQMQEDLIGPRWYSENDLCTSCTTTACSCNSFCNLHLSPGHSKVCSSPYCGTAPIFQPSSQIHIQSTALFINFTKKRASIE
ncbi:unnamed protein product [Dibothriocephalus latus]|uniref:G-protein coupled receptors family 1 profile domain-containing protein n=1 Tax=Dibothriocephalus latus TaxID=60516 RepID=A0A3P6PSS9_DIBLA|nr:unnamed protein product [Dibothriocephalus latus]